MKESYIKKLIRILQESKVDSLEISSFWGMSNIKLSKNSRKHEAAPIAYSNSEPKSIIIDQEKAIPREEELKIKDEIESDHIDQEVNTPISDEVDLSFITAPLVGTYYSSPKPDDPSFVKKGDRIEVGQTVCIIEAMKIFNEIDSEMSGTVEEVLVDDGAPVEYGQKIISIRLDD